MERVVHNKSLALYSSHNKSLALYAKLSFGVVFFILHSSFFISHAQAAAYTASDCVGQLDGSAACTFTTSTGGTTNQTLQGVNGVAVDNTNNRLFVADRANNRILVFNINADGTLPNRTADAVLGQANFTSAGAGTTAATLFSPGGLAYDATNNRLYAADTNNNRVLVYDVTAITDGEAAANVLGQADFTSGGFGTTIATMRTPGSVAYASNLLYVADAGNSRILVFNVATITNGEDAVNVLGQADFTSNAGATSQAGLSGANGVALDTTNNRLFVADGGNSRIVVFDVAAITNGEAAANVLGQANFTSSAAATTQSGLSGPTGIAYDSTNSRLIAADTTNNRVMIFDVAAITNGENAVKVLGQANYTGSSAATTQAGQSTPTSVAIDTTNAHLWVGDSANRRVLLYKFIRITTTSPMTAGEVNTAYSQTVATTASQNTVTFSTAAGSLPTALSLGASTGTISGTPTTAATSNFTTRATDSDTDTGDIVDDQALAITIAADSTGPVISSVASSSVTSSGATITWTTNEAASSQVQYSTDLSYGTSTTEADTVTRVTAHSVAVTGLTAGTTYNFRVRSGDAASNYTNSTNNTLTTSAAGGTNVAINPPPGKPTALNVSCVGSATPSCTVSWADPADNDLSRIEVWRNDGTGTAVTGPRAFVNPGVGTYKDTDGIVVGKTYTYQLVAVDSGGSKNASDEASGTVSAAAEAAPPPAKPKVEDTAPKPKLELSIEVKVISTNKSLALSDSTKLSFDKSQTPTQKSLALSDSTKLSSDKSQTPTQKSLALSATKLSFDRSQPSTSSLAFALSLSTLLLFSVLLHGHHGGKQGPIGFFALFPLLLTSSHNSYMYFQRCGPEACRGQHFSTHRVLKHGARASLAATAVAGAVKLVLAIVLTSAMPNADIFAQQLSAKAGDTVAATLTVRNTGNASATNLVVSVPTPTGTSFQGLIVNNIASTLTPTGETLSVPFASLLPSASHVLESKYLVGESPPAALTLTASATASETASTVFAPTAPVTIPIVTPALPPPPPEEPLPVVEEQTPPPAVEEVPPPVEPLPIEQPVEPPPPPVEPPQPPVEPPPPPPKPEALPIPPAPPTGLVVQIIATERRIALAWSDNSDNETHFEVERSGDGVSFLQIAKVLANLATYNDFLAVVEGQVAPGIYAYRVKASNQFGDSQYSEVAEVKVEVAEVTDVTEAAKAAEVTNVELIFNTEDFNIATGGEEAVAPGLVPVIAVLEGTALESTARIEIVFESDPIVLAFVPEGPTWQYVAQATLPVGTHTMSVFAVDTSGVRAPIAAPIRFEVTLPQCFDGVDNDHDGFQDHPDDPGCESRADNDEADPITAVVETVVEKILAPIISEQAAQKAVETVSKTVTTVQKSKTYQTLDKQIVNNPKVEAVNQTVAAPVVVAVAAANTATAASAPTLLIYLRYLITQPLLLFTRRRRKAWGTVYSSLAKVPVDLALVRLIDQQSGRLLGTRVTDRQGRYMFLTDPGKYRLEVAKANYAFPSQFLAGKKEDVEYKGLYHGEPIPVASARTTITPPVPVDPAAREETPADVLARARKMKLQRAGALAGPILAVGSLVISPTMGMVGAAVGQLALLGLFNRLAAGRKPKSWGKVVDAAGKPLTQAICRIFDSQFNKLLETQVTDKYGRYAFLVGKGNFYITVDKPGYGQYKSEVLDLSAGIVKKDVSLKKA